MQGKITKLVLNQETVRNLMQTSGKQPLAAGTHTCAHPKCISHQVCDQDEAAKQG